MPLNKTVKFIITEQTFHISRKDIMDYLEKYEKLDFSKWNIEDIYAEEEGEDYGYGRFKCLEVRVSLKEKLENSD